MIKVYAIAAGVIVLIAAAFWGYQTIYSEGKKAGAATVQSAWDTDKAAIAAQTAQAIAQATKQRDDALEANEAIHNDYQAQLSAATASAQSLAQRLRDTQARLAASSSTMPKAGGGQSTAGAGPASSDAGLTGAVAAVFQECTDNAAQLDALIAEISPQL